MFKFIRNIIATCCNPGKFQDSASDLAEDTVKSVTEVNQKMKSYTDNAVQACWRGVVEVASSVLAIAGAIAITGFQAAVTAFRLVTTPVLLVARLALLVTSHLGALMISAFLGWCLIATYVLFVLTYPIRVVLQVWTSTQKPKEQQKPILELVEIKPIEEKNEYKGLMQDLSELNNPKLWSIEDLQNHIDMLNKKFNAKIENHRQPGVKRITLTRKIKDCYLNLAVKTA
jgi:hypothetical protein